MKKRFLTALLISSACFVNAQVSTSYYLPQDIGYNSDIPSPKEFFGHEIGEWHLSHDRLYMYMLELSEVSDRAVWEEYGRSYENRPLGHLIISSPENIKNLETLRRQHLQLCDPHESANVDIGKMPLFIKMGYGIHGNESSAQNASALVAYWLVAGEGPSINELLNNIVILIDPSLNPDGMQRHSTWVNSARSLRNNPDPFSWEFSESWPGGRTNHYWFDLNRDYIMLQHPESKGRVAAFHRWKPNINTDHHETGPNETFFFQPGVQSRNNPLTPADNSELTAQIGKYHEKFLNDIGSLYFTEESFDDFYVGKGSSYPDIHGSVGILFEQAGTKGHLRETPGRLLSFPFAIRNQFTVSLSTLEAGLKMKNQLLESQKRFYRDALAEAEKHPVKAYIFGEPADHSRLNAFLNILLWHKIKVYKPARNIEKNGITYSSSSSFIVPLKQVEYRFIRSLFEPVTNFSDSVFYDVSTWVLPMSFNLNYAPLMQDKEIEGLTGPEVTEAPRHPGQLISPEKPYAYLFEWTDYYAPKALYRLQENGLTTRVSGEKFTCIAGNGKRTFTAGTIVIPCTGQPIEMEELQELMKKVSDECGISIYGVQTGLTETGVDLGSNRIQVVSRPSVAMVVGDGISSSVSGEIWHLLDSRFGIPVTLIPVSKFGSSDLNRYNSIIIAGSPEIGAAGMEKIKSWMRQGRNIIAVESGNRWIVRNNLAEIEYIPEVTVNRKEGAYSNQGVDRQVHQIPGSIFQVGLDLTHPLCYGYTGDIMPVFKSNQNAVAISSDIYNNPVRYSENPLLSGYCSDENINRVRNSAYATVHRNGIISLYDNPNFRAFWYGTNKVFLNAIFFGQLINK
ncbi:MAG: zinc carboxypeptidase [Bacteroidales bacterium]|nr:zinc carboxypeptidase [Bacteroidales bacterium]